MAIQTKEFEKYPIILNSDIKQISNGVEYNGQEIQKSQKIKEYNSFVPNGYNINIGGKGGDNFKYHTDQEKVKDIFKKLINLTLNIN